MKYTIAIAGTTARTKRCAQALFESELFDVSWVLTPTAKPVGRKQVLTPNPMEIFAHAHNIPLVFVEHKIDANVQNAIEQLPRPDLLLVVDFGYIVPKWLLDVPIIASLNIHPSQLPRWRGSSPGQFTLLFGEKKSAVTLMVMDSKLDHGPIIHQDFFAIEDSWNQTEYYEQAFALMCTNLDIKIADFAQKHSNPTTKDAAATSQPDESTTQTAHQLTKEHAFVPWTVLRSALSGTTLTPSELESAGVNPLLLAARQYNSSLAKTLERASKAFDPWPGLWTLIPTQKGEKRLKIISATVKTTVGTATTEEKLELKTVQLEGKSPIQVSSNEWLNQIVSES